MHFIYQYISMDNSRNSAWNKIRSHEFYLTYKLIQHKHGANTSCFKSLRKLSGTIWQMNSYKRFNNDSVMWYILDTLSPKTSGALRETKKNEEDSLY